MAAKTTGGVTAKVSTFTPSAEDLAAQKYDVDRTANPQAGMKSLSEAEKAVRAANPAPKVSSFIPSAEDVAAQRYDTVGAKGKQPGMQTLASKERIIQSGYERPASAGPIQAPELKASMQRGIEPKSSLTLAPEKTAAFEMAPVKGGYEHIPQQKAGIFKTRPSAIKMYADFAAQEAAAREAVPTPSQFAYEKFAGVGPKSDVRPMTADEAQLVESMDRAKKAGAGRVAEARMGVGAAQPATTQVVDTTIPKYASEAARANAMGTATGLAGSIIQSPEIAVQTNEALRRKGLKGIIPQQGGEEMLTTQFGRWLGGKAYDITHPSKEVPATEQPSATQAAGKPLTTPATYIPGGALDQAAPAGQKAQPKQFETTRVPEAQTTISTEPKAPSFTREQVEGMAEKGQAVSRGSGGNFRYVQGPNGSIVKQNTDTGEVVPMSVQGITGNILKPGEESPLAREARTRKETAFRDALVRQAFQPIDANTNVADVGTIKRNRLAAQQLLEQMDRSQQAGAQLGMEEKKLASQERATTATQEQNRLVKEQEAQYRRDKLGLEERRTVAAEESAKNKPRTAVYKGQKIQGSPEELAYEKSQIDAKQASAWDKKNPKPSGMLTTNDDVIKHYEKRAKELGYNPDVGKASKQASAISSILGRVSPQQASELSAEFEREYGVPYSEFITEE